MVHSYFNILLYTPMEEDVTLQFNTFETPLPKDTLCQEWLKFAWLGDSEEVNMWKDMDRHLDRQKDRNTDRQIEA